jgi:O-antigen ligase
MAPHLALLVYGLFIIWLFVREYKQGSAVSSALWIPFLWMFVLGSRPVTLWLGLGMKLDSSVDYSEGTPADRFAFICLIFAGLFVLSRRNIGLARLIQCNKCLFIFYLFWGVSILWSPDSFVSFKRWIKDLGNVVMVLVVLTDENPVAAVKALFARFMYLLIPLSVLFIKYFPDLGRAYNHWTWLPTITGVTTDKNALGELVLVCGLAFLWDVLDTGLGGDRFRSRQDRLAKTVLALMTIWLMINANSATSLVCLLLGIALLFALRNPKVRRNIRHIEKYAVVLALMIGLFNLILPVNNFFVQGLGRNLTLTDRTYIWQLALAADQNPLLGTGFYSFWLTPTSEKITDVYKEINNAHNGYLETYLNGGLVAVALLGIALVFGYRKIKGGLMLGSRLAPLWLIFYVTALVHNVTEASFNRIDIIWFVLLLSMVNVSPFVSEEPQKGSKPGAIGTTREPDGFEAEMPGSQAASTGNWRICQPSPKQAG